MSLTNHLLYFNYTRQNVHKLQNLLRDEFDCDEYMCDLTIQHNIHIYGFNLQQQFNQTVSSTH